MSHARSLTRAALGSAVLLAAASPVASRSLAAQWDDATGAIEGVNAVVAEDVPAVYDRLNGHGIHPDVGEPIAMPERSGG